MGELMDAERRGLQSLDSSGDVDRCTAPRPCMDRKMSDATAVGRPLECGRLHRSKQETQS